MIEPGAAVRCWGSNRSQQCGVTSATPITAPTAVAALASSTRLALGDVHGISLGATPRGWGLNDLGQIASQVVSNTTLYPPSPCCSSPLLSGLSAVASGWYHACGITGAGTVACWGYNVSGQLGNNTTTQATSGMSSAPVTVLTAAGPLTGAVELALGRYHSCARTASRRVYCWGSNNRGQLGRAASPAVPSFAAAVLDGASELQGVDEIAAGEEFSCARVGGTVRCWGDNLRGDTGAPSPSREVSAPNLLAPIADAVEIAAGQHFACAIRAEGRVHCWGYNMEGQAGVGASGSPVLASAANLLRADGVGGPVLTGAVQLALGGAFGCAALRSGALVCWGRNAEGQLGDGTTVTRFWTARAAWPR
jgi:alpha-tubulin suppressor-like RCC1 family protein